MQRCSRRRRGRDNDHHATARTRLRALLHDATRHERTNPHLVALVSLLRAPTPHQPRPHSSPLHKNQARLAVSPTKPKNPNQTRDASAFSCSSCHSPTQRKASRPRGRRPRRRRRWRWRRSRYGSRGEYGRTGEAQVPAAGGGERRQEDEGDAAAGRRAPRRCGVGLRLRRLLRVRVRVARAWLSSPARLLARIRDAYVGGMLAVSRKASGMSLPNAPEGCGPGACRAGSSSRRRGQASSPTSSRGSSSRYTSPSSPPRSSPPCSTTPPRTCRSSTTRRRRRPVASC